MPHDARLGFNEFIPHNKALGMALLELERGEAKFKLPYDAKLVGNPDTGVLHGGAITALLDACCGGAVLLSLDTLQPIATLDLRIDYLGPAEPNRDVHARADCYKVTRNVAFVRAVAYHDDVQSPIASAAGTFMVGTQARRTP